MELESMWICSDMDFAFKEDRLRREKEQKNQEKISKLKALIADSGSTGGEKQSARLALKRLEINDI